MSTPESLPKSSRKVYCLYRYFKGIHFNMPGGWNDKYIGIFVESCRKYIDDLKNPDPTKRWKRICFYGGKIAQNPKLFSLNSCIEVAQCIKTFVVQYRQIMADNTAFNNFCHEVEDLLEHFPANPNANRVVPGASGELTPGQYLNEMFFGDVVFDLIKFKDIPSHGKGKKAFWDDLSRDIHERYGVSFDVKEFIEKKKKIAVSEAMKVALSQRKAVFCKLASKFLKVFDHVEPTSILKSKFLGEGENSVNTDVEPHKLFGVNVNDIVFRIRPSSTAQVKRKRGRPRKDNGNAQKDKSGGKSESVAGNSKIVSTRNRLHSQLMKEGAPEKTMALRVLKAGDQPSDARGDTQASTAQSTASSSQQNEHLQGKLELPDETDQMASQVDHLDFPGNSDDKKRPLKKRGRPPMRAHLASEGSLDISLIRDSSATSCEDTGWTSASQLEQSGRNGSAGSSSTKNCKGLEAENDLQKKTDIKNRDPNPAIKDAQKTEEGPKFKTPLKRKRGRPRKIEKKLKTTNEIRNTPVDEGNMLDVVGHSVYDKNRPFKKRLRSGFMNSSIENMVDEVEADGFSNSNKSKVLTLATCPFKSLYPAVNKDNYDEFSWKKSKSDKLQKKNTREYKRRIQRTQDEHRSNRATIRKQIKEESDEEQFVEMSDSDEEKIQSSSKSNSFGSKHQFSLGYKKTKKPGPNSTSHITKEEYSVQWDKNILIKSIDFNPVVKLIDLKDDPSIFQKYTIVTKTKQTSKTKNMRITDEKIVTFSLSPVRRKRGRPPKRPNTSDKGSIRPDECFSPNDGGSSSADKCSRSPDRKGRTEEPEAEEGEGAEGGEGHHSRQKAEGGQDPPLGGELAEIMRQLAEPTIREEDVEFLKVMKCQQKELAGMLTCSFSLTRPVEAYDPVKPNWFGSYLADFYSWESYKIQSMAKDIKTKMEEENRFLDKFEAFIDTLGK